MAHPMSQWKANSGWLLSSSQHVRHIRYSDQMMTHWWTARSHHCSFQPSGTSPSTAWCACLLLLDFAVMGTFSVRSQSRWVQGHAGTSSKRWSSSSEASRLLWPSEWSQLGYQVSCQLHFASFNSDCVPQLRDGTSYRLRLDQVDVFSSNFWRC